MPPQIKEPNYFFTADTNESPILKKILAPGNHSRGPEWYDALYQRPATDCWLIDMSTQYWLYPEQVIKYACRSYQPTFIVIERPRNEQLVSYLSHLRRGHIEDKPIAGMYKNDPKFAEYLDRMSRWTEDYQVIKNNYPDLTFVDVLFEDLISDPLTTMKEIIPGAAGKADIDLSSTKNPRSYPRFEWLNNLFFSNTLRNIGRYLPQFMYSGLIRFRKFSVKLNLKAGQSKHFEKDRVFINRKYN